MALLFCDGFEMQLPDEDKGIWDIMLAGGSSSTKVIYQNSVVRTGEGALRIRRTVSTADQSGLAKTLPSTPSEVYCGFGFRWDDISDGNQRIIEFRSSGGTVQFYILLNQSTHKLECYQGDGTQLGSATKTLASPQMHYVEFHLVIDDAAGSIELRIDQNVEINATGLDTNNADGDIEEVRLGSVTITDAVCDFYFDDFCIMDTTGSVANSWPAGAGVERLDPDADGNYSQWTSTGGANDASEVDDVATYGNTPDDDTTKISHATVGERTSVGLDNTTITGTVLGLMLLSYVKNSASGADQMSQFVRIGATDYDQTAFTPDTSYGWRVDVLTTSPATADAWTTGEIDGIEMGWKVE